MATLVEVLAEFFRAFGYTPNLNVELEGTTGRRHAVALVLEKDNRRIAVTTWVHAQSLGPTFLREFMDAVKDTGCDGGLIASLGATPETILVEASQNAIAVWDSRRTAQELGNAVLRETCPTVWGQTDPMTAPRPSRILEHVHKAVAGEAATPTPAIEAPSAPLPTEAPQPTTPMEPTPMAMPETLQLPLAFGVLDQAMAPAPEPAPFTPPAPAAPSPAGPRVLRAQVAKQLAANLAKAKTRTTDRIVLRLVPYHVFDYEASLLVEGSLQSERRTGRMAVEAATKRIHEWAWPLDAGGLPSDASDVDEKPIRISEEDAKKILATELRALVTRDVVQEEDDSEWSVVVKKKVELAEEELRMTPLGVHYVPVWRVSGRDGSVEIDATNGRFIHEDLTVAQSDALLI